ASIPAPPRSNDIATQSATDIEERPGSAGARRASKGGLGGPPRAPHLLNAGGRFLERGGPQDAGDLLGVEGLALEEGAGQRVQLLDVALDDLLGPRGAVHHDALDLGVDGQRGVLAVVLLARHLAAEEDVLLVLAEGERPE